MRVLFTIQPASGHLHPLVSLARALKEAGHDVRFATAPSFRADVEASGFVSVPAGYDWLESDQERLFPTPPGRERNEWFLAAIFADLTARRMVPDILDLASSWRPDILVREPVEFGGVIAAEVLGLPFATAGFAMPWPLAWWQGAIGREMAAIRQAYELPPDPGLTMLYRYLDLAFMPPWFYEGIGEFVPPTMHFLRPSPFDRSGDEQLPGWLAVLPDRPTVYATLGTAYNHETGLFEAILEALSGEPVNLILTIGRNRDPGEFGSQPANIRIERYIPQSLLFPYCDLIVTHGGFNTVLAALSAGVPLVVIPLGADQFTNAARCVSLGVGKAIEPRMRTPEAIRAAVGEVLADPAYRENARRLQSRMESLPGPEYGVRLLEEFVAATSNR